ncbi:MAG: two-component system response regulator [Candidatus Omnitrophota bacterium]|nr:MAG: two-component system response regulator [Candidatus Omnitrophota bacterium]
MNELIAVIDDEPDILELVSLHLTKVNFKVKGFLNTEGFFKFLSSKIPDLIILDLMLPDSDGIEICKYLKSKEDLKSIPIIMLTARATETDKVLGLELGADDYVTKPFSPRELVARVKAVLRRKTQDSGKKIKIDDILLIDLNKFEVFVENKKIDLTPTEFRILKILTSKKGWVFTRDQILNHLWGEEKAVLDRTIDVHIKNLREKLGKAKKFIKNVRGIGYKVEE